MHDGIDGKNYPYVLLTKAIAFGRSWDSKLLLFTMYMLDIEKGNQSISPHWVDSFRDLFRRKYYSRPILIRHIVRYSSVYSPANWPRAGYYFGRL